MIQIIINDISNKVRATLLTGLSTATNAVITASDTVLSAFGKLQAQITALSSSLANYVTNSSLATTLLGYATTSQLADKQDKRIVVSSNQTAVNDGAYTLVANATFTDPSPVEGKGFSVLIRNGTATIGGTAYSTVGTTVWRLFHSGAWDNYVNQLGLGFTPENVSNKTTNISGIAGTYPDTPTVKTYVDSVAYKKIHRQFGLDTTTATTETIIRVCAIPENSFVTDDVMEFFCKLYSTGTSLAFQPKLYIGINAAPSDLTGATLIATGTSTTSAAGGAYGLIHRQFQVGSNFLRSFAATFDRYSESIQTTGGGAPANIGTINWTVNNYIYITITHAVAGTKGCYFSEIIKT